MICQLTLPIGLSYRDSIAAVLNAIASDLISSFDTILGQQSTTTTILTSVNQNSLGTKAGGGNDNQVAGAHFDENK